MIGPRTMPPLGLVDVSRSVLGRIRALHKAEGDPALDVVMLEAALRAMPVIGQTSGVRLRVDEHASPVPRVATS